MTVSLRAHHLLCILTYAGKGYTPEFVSGYNSIIDRLNEGEAIALTNGPDEICQPLLSHNDCHCHNESVRIRDQKALSAIGAALESNLEAGQELRLGQEEISQLRQSFQNGSIREACAGCEWHQLCDVTAAKGFKGCRLSPQTMPETKQ